MRGCSCRGTAGFAHVSCLAEQAKIWVEEAEENNLGDQGVEQERWGGGTRVACASKTTMAWWRARSGGRAGRRTWAGRRWTGLGVMQCTCLGTVYPLQITMRMHCPVKEAQLSIERRLGASEHYLLTAAGQSR